MIGDVPKSHPYLVRTTGCPLLAVIFENDFDLMAETEKRLTLESFIEHDGAIRVYTLARPDRRIAIL
jgi:hypothetical protein